MTDISLGFLDLVLLVGSILFSVLIGLYFTNKNKSIDSYMRADRKLSVMPVAVSLMSSCLSALTLLGSCAELYYQGPTYSLVAIAMLLSGPITAFTVLPVFYRMNELSLYKYLHKRYGAVVKYLVSPIYMADMIFKSAVVMYLPAMALQSIIGISKLYSILFIGLMCVTYSSIGGIKAVVWTDFFQAILMYLSVGVVGVLGTIDAGGITKVFELARDGRRLDFEPSFFKIDLTTRHTLFGVLVGSTLKHIFLIGVSQVQMQRALGLASLRKAQWSFIWCSVFTALISILSSYMGLVLYSAYGSCDPYLAHEIPRRDGVILHYVARRLSRVPGIRGIFIAGILSATLSNLSSVANSMSALALEDFIKPIRRCLGKDEMSERAKTLLAKLLATIFGSFCVLVACSIDKSSSRLLQATSTMSAAVGVPFVTAFLLGIFTRYTNTTGILTGFLVTLSLGLYITFQQTFYGESLDPVMPVHYDDKCASVFNMTLSPDALAPNVGDLIWLAPVEPPIALHKISYMTLPIVQFVLTVVVASLASLASGGWSQEVDDQYLVSMKHTRKLKDSTLV